MVNIDLMTSAFVTLVSMLLALLIILFVRQKYRKAFKGINYFVFHYLLMAVGFALLIFASSLPVFVGIVVGNSIVFAAFLFALFGVMLFYDVDVKPIYILFAVLLFVPFYSAFVYVDFLASVKIRIIIMSSVAAIAHFSIFYIIFDKTRKDETKLLMLPLNLVAGCGFAVRIILTILTFDLYDSHMENIVDAVVILAAGLVSLLIVVGIYDMISVRFNNDIQELYRSKKQILDNLPGFVYRYKNDEDLTIEYASSSIVEFTGYDRDELIDNKFRSYMQIIVPKYRDMVRQEVNKSLEQDVPFNLEYEIIKKDGKKAWLEERGKGLPDADGNITAIEGVALDITQQKKEREKLSKLAAENELLDRKFRNQQRIDAISVLAGAMGHEINNPINGIMNYGQIILDAPLTDGETKGLAKEIISEAQRISKIIHSLTSFAGDKSERIDNVVVGELIDGTLVLIRNMFKRDSIEIQENLEDSHQTIRCNEQMIKQVILSIMINSRDYLNLKYKEPDENKKIIISSKTIKKDALKYIRIEIKDLGMGIPNDVEERIFDPFFTTKNRAEAKGLGLSLSRKIINDHRGELSFESKEGEYTKFFVDLPIE